ncbi:flagellar protein FliJ [Spirochaetia bacterium]|nr:flagellar protein FliJ [Spirochaetia bacterium]
MKRFRFSLEKILDLRKHREQETEIELGRAIGELTEIENRIKALAVEKTKAAKERFSLNNGAIEIQSYELYIMRLDQTRDRLMEEAAKAELKVEAARKVYLEASRDRKVFDKLKEKRETEYRKEMFAEETKVLDDISSGSRARKMIAADGQY